MLLKIVMSCNVFQFGDMYWLQTDGTTIGTSSAGMFATLYYAFHERIVLELFAMVQFNVHIASLGSAYCLGNWHISTQFNVTLGKRNEAIIPRIHRMITRSTMCR